MKRILLTTAPLLALVALPAVSTTAGAKAPTPSSRPASPDQRPVKSPNRASLKDLKRVVGKSPRGRISLKKSTEFSPAHAAPVDWGYLKFLESVYTSGSGYAGTGYASFHNQIGKAILVLVTKPNISRVVSCGVHLKTAQTMKVRQVVYGENVAAGKVIVNENLQAGVHQLNFVASGYTAPKYQYSMTGTESWNLLYCDVFSAD